MSNTKTLNEDSLLNQYFNIVDATNTVSKTDIYGVITYANSKFIELSGYTEDELIGQPHSIVRDPQTDNTLFKELWITIQSKNIWRGIITNLNKNGNRYTVNASIFPIINNYGEIVEYIAIRHDITQILELHTYQTEQEHIAREKLESGIVNDMTQKECQVLYYPSDILSGDFYSIYKLDNGSIFIYLMDGQGHGVSPALTVFAISSMMNQNIYNIKSLNEIMQQLSPNVKNFLSEEEQLSYTMIMISADKKNISYSSAGMYPFLIKQGDEVTKIKANNTPFMNFSPTPIIDSINLDSWDSLMIYSDGIVEHENTAVNHCSPQKLIEEPACISKAMNEICSHKFDDDITLLYLENSL